MHAVPREVRQESVNPISVFFIPDKYAYVRTRQSPVAGGYEKLFRKQVSWISVITIQKIKEVSNMDEERLDEHIVYRKL